MSSPVIFSLYKRMPFAFARVANPAYKTKPYYRPFGALDSVKSLCTVKPDELDSVEDLLNAVAAGADLPGLQMVEPIYADVSEVPSLSVMLNAHNRFLQDFEALPARLRREFDDDPEVFAYMLDKSRTDPKMREALTDLGVFGESGSPFEGRPQAKREQTQTAEAKPVGEPAQASADDVMQAAKQAAKAV